MKKKEINLFAAGKEGADGQGGRGNKSKSKKNFDKKAFFKRFALSALSLAVLAFSFGYALKNIDYADKKLTGGTDYKCIVNLWHVDSFEGGTGSRAEFLLGRAAAFEKNNAGVFVMVTPMTAENANEKFAAGERPDMISYGYGVEISGYSAIKSDKKCVYGQVDGDVYALPWCRGGYAVISNEPLPEDKTLENAVVSKGAYTQPYAALALGGYTLKNYEEKAPLDAYYAFVSGNADILVGTQRDVNRLNVRQMEAVITPLSEYSDLYQYISVTAASAEKKAYAEMFIEFLLSEEAQKKVSNLGMFSPYYRLSYDLSGLEEMQTAIQKSAAYPVFTPLSVFGEFSENALLAAKGDEAALKKLKNLLI